MCTVLFVIYSEDYLNVVVNVGLIWEDRALLICSLVFVLYDIHVVCDSVVAMFSSHFVMRSSLADLLREGILGLLSRYTPLLVGTQALRRAFTTRLRLSGWDVVGVVVII